MTTDDPLLSFRSHFPILERSTYLVSNSLGAMPRQVSEDLATYTEEWASRGVRAWAEGWWDLPVRMGNRIAPLIGAQEGQVVMVPTVTSAMCSVLSAIPLAPGRNEVVMTALDFPSVRYAYDALAPKLGAKIVVVPTDDGIGIDTARVLDAITERTALVAISHVLFRSAFIMDAAAICERAREVGARTVLDAYHSVGVMPVNVVELGVDFLCGGVLKWLCGGPGGCFLYASADATISLSPAFTGWQAHATPFAFADEMTYTSSTMKWLGGTPVVPALYAGMAGPGIVLQAGADAVRAKSIRQTTLLIEAADARGWRVNTPRSTLQRGGTVACDVPHAAEVAKALLAEDVVIDYRPGAGIRIAPHFYSTDEELVRCVGAIVDILENGRWQSFQGVHSTVT